MPPAAELIEITDAGRGVGRFAVLVADRLEACLLLAAEGSGAALPARETLAALLGGEVTDAARAGLLAGRAGAQAEPVSRTVCACFSVSLARLRAAVADEHLTSLAEIGRVLRAGTGCGSCIPELKEILHDAHAAAA